MTARERVEGLSRRCQRIEGMRDEMAARMFTLVSEVALAKGALDLRDDIETTMSEFQSLVHGRTVGLYEVVLTEFVRAVMTDDSSVSFDLFSDNGAPGLNITAMTNGHRFNIANSRGGSLMDVVSVGLRLIATLRAAARPFLVLDEAERGVQSDRIPFFYKALSDLSSSMGLQVIAITHKPLHLLEASCPRIFRVHGDPLSPEGVKVSVVAPGRAWSGPEERGLRSIRLSDMAGYRDETFQLAPGLNIVTGENEVGKSRLVRAIRVCCYGDSDDMDINVHATSATVAIEAEAGETVEWTRAQRRTPVVQWRRLSRKGDALVTLATHGGRLPPPWVDEVVGVAFRSGIDVQARLQPNAVFLLDGNARQRAEVLSVGRESGLLQDMMRLHKKDVVAQQACVRTGEREMAVLSTRLAALSSLASLKDDLDGISRGLLLTERRKAHIHAMRFAASSLDSGSASLDAHVRRHAIAAAVEGMPASRSDVSSEARRNAALIGSLRSEARRADGLLQASHGVAGREMDPLRDTQDMRVAAFHISSSLDGLRLSIERLSVMDSLPAILPAMQDHAGAMSLSEHLTSTDCAWRQRADVELPSFPTLAYQDALKARTAGQSLMSAFASIAECTACIGDASTRLGALEGEWADAMRGRACPTCGQGWPTHAGIGLLDAHAHSDADVESSDG